MHIKIPYGQDEAEFDVPDENLLMYCSPKKVREIEDLKAETIRLLRNPTGSKPLSNLVGPGKKIAILVDDWARPTQPSQILAAIIEELKRAGVSEKDITIVIAKGTHRDCTEEELRRKIGEQLLGQFRVIQHDCDDEKQLTYIGTTSFGTPVWVNRLVLEADFKIGIGNLMANHISGFGGGSKIVLPGVCGRDTIEQNHSMEGSIHCRLGNMKGNPVRQDMNEVAKMVGFNFIVNTILNSRKKIIRLVAGNVVRAHERGAAIIRQLYGVRVRKKADIAVVSATPADLSLFYSEKAATIGRMVTKDGGTVVLVSPCPDGIGGSPPEDFWKFMVERAKPEEVLRLVVKKQIPGSPGGVVLWWREVLQDREVVVVTKGIESDRLEKMGLRRADSVQLALEYAFGKHGRNAEVAVLESALLLPLVSR